MKKTLKPRPRRKTSAGPSLPPEYLFQLTALRGFGALYVAGYHAQTVIPIPVIFHRGYIAVDFFFLLSGFILMHAYGKAFQKPTWDTYLRFLILRLGRIYPIHLLTLLMMAALSVLPFVSLSREGFFENLFLVQSWGFTPWLGWNIPAWSLSCEWLCYLLFPALVWLVLRCRTAFLKTLLYFATLLALQFMIVAHPRHSMDMTYYGGTVRALAEFLQGMLLYQLSSLVRGRVGDRSLIVALLAGIFIELSPTHWEFLITLPLGLILLSVAHGRGLFSHVLRQPLWHHLGEISLSLYLLHFPIMVALTAWIIPGVTRQPHAGIILIVLFYLLLIGSAWLCYLVLERPMRSLVHHRFG